MRRIPDVADCWFDSGAMQVAQWHYPFENEDLLAQSHPADFICEAVDQTRGWFYTLHAVGNLLFGKPAFKNVICLGHILDAEGQKMSKSKGNIIYPWEVFDEYGVDALRWNLFSSAPPGNPRRFSTSQVGETLRQFLLTLWNTYSFFVTYANLDGWQPDDANAVVTDSLPLIDKWALARLHGLIRDTTASLEDYDVTTASRAIEHFVDELSNWYVRRNRRRFWKSEADIDKRAAYQTLYTCLTTVSRLAAPFAPFITEAIYRNLVASQPNMPESVHLSRWPQLDESLLDDRLVDDMEVVIEVVSLGRAARKTSGLKVRQPLSEAWVRVSTPAAVEGVRRFEAEVREELNIKAVRYLDASSDFVDYHCKPNLRAVGKKYGKLVPKLTAALRDLTPEEARAIAHAIEGGTSSTITIEGERYELLPEEVLVATSSPEGYAVAEHNGVLVALNTTVTPELRLEGAARDLVRNIQDARKNAGLAISDRIALYLSDGEQNGFLQQVTTTWSEYIKVETLATTLVVGAAPQTAHTEAVSLEEGTVTVGIVAESA
jgi:isoleucyl-tRNA synthetase